MLCITRRNLDLPRVFIHQRHDREDLCSLSGLRLDRERSVQQMYPFLHAYEPNPRFLFAASTSKPAPSSETMS